MTELKVLIPLDRSAIAERALAYLPILSQLGDLHVRLISVVATSEADTSASGQPPDLTERGVLLAYLLRQEMGLGRTAIAVESKVCHGVPSAVILVEASQFKADLILMSTHGRTGVQRWRLGSVTDKIARSARNNLLIVPPPPEGVADAPPGGSVLVPLDGSPEAERALSIASRITQTLGAELHVAHVLTAAAMADASNPGSQNSAIDASKAYLGMKLVEAKQEKAVASVLVGAPDEALLKYSASQGISLIVLTAHGGGNGSQFGLGRVAERLLRGHTPALLVRSSDSEAAGIFDSHRYVA